MSKSKPPRLTPLEKYISTGGKKDKRERYEERQRREGLKVVSVRVHVDDAQAVKDFAHSLRERRKVKSDD